MAHGTRGPHIVGRPNQGGEGILVGLQLPPWIRIGREGVPQGLHPPLWKEGRGVLGGGLLPKGRPALLATYIKEGGAAKEQAKAQPPLSRTPPPPPCPSPSPPYPDEPTLPTMLVYFFIDAGALPGRLP